MMQSSKIYSGFSTCFRQWRADHTHCSKLHGYAIEIKIIFEGDLDSYNWVYDFGGFKRSNILIDQMNPKDWLDYMFDHTTIIAQDDPFLDKFKELDDLGIIQLRILENVGAEKFAEYIFGKLSLPIYIETNQRVRIKEVELIENKNNSAKYIAK